MFPHKMFVKETLIVTKTLMEQMRQYSNRILGGVRFSTHAIPVLTVHAPVILVPKLPVQHVL